ncbi:MAG: hypothetical protein U9R02_10860 [Thermodesulfobacteriota bacterium]|nr:hypothetical protein [Thermodesulfobacteriota bacterium]
MKFKINSDSHELSKLRGIKILYENDLYEFAKIVLNIMDASDKMNVGTKTISRPTINGLSKKYSWICGDKITSDQIIKIVMQHGLKGNDSIDFDENDERRYVSPKIGTKKI